MKDCDNVNHPGHYTNGPICPGCGRVIECIDITRGMGFCDGNAMKYLWRYKHKGNPKEDIRKAKKYLEFLEEGLSREGA